MQIKSAFDLLGFDCDPDDLTERVGRTPTRHFRKGNVPRAGAAPYPQSGWIIASGVMDNLSMSAHVAGTIELAQLILPRIPDYTAEKTISCALYKSESWRSTDLLSGTASYCRHGKSGGRT